MDKINVSNGKATGIRLTSGEERSADIVISAADGQSTIYGMLDGKFRDKTIDKYYNSYKVFPSFIQVSLGLNREMKDIEPNQIFPVNGGFRIDRKTTLDLVGVRIFNFDPTLAPRGKTAVTALIPTEDSQYWVELKARDSREYRAEKKRISDKITEVLETRLGNIRKYVEVTDVATPSSVIRYTGNWKGSLEGWVLTPELGFAQMEKTLPGLRGFYMIGQWVEPGGGLPPAMMSGRAVAQIICKEDHKEFITKSY